MKEEMEKATKWWNNLPFEERIDKKMTVLGNLISMEDLSGFEVVFIYNFYHQ